MCPSSCHLSNEHVFQVTGGDPVGSVPNIVPSTCSPRHCFPPALLSSIHHGIARIIQVKLPPSLQKLNPEASLPITADQRAAARERCMGSLNSCLIMFHWSSHPYSC